MDRARRDRFASTAAVEFWSNLRRSAKLRGGDRGGDRARFIARSSLMEI